MIMSEDKKSLKTDILLHVDDKISDSELSFMGMYLPDSITGILGGIESVGKIFYSLPPSYSGRLKDNPSSIVRKGKNELIFLKEILGNTDAGHIAKIFCDSPFLSREIISEMLELHRSSLSEFTYSENLPSGFGCEIVSRELVESMPEGDREITLGELIRSNINQFDVELYYREPDIRDKRISFRAGNIRDRRIMENIYNLGGRVPQYSQIREIINGNPGVLYTGPSYLEIELSGRCDLDCIFCYRKTLEAAHGDMSTDLFRKILVDMRAFGLPYSVCLGGSGEPMMHGGLYGIIDLLSKEDNVRNIVVETNGLYADDNFKSLLASDNDGRIKVIFNINGIDDDTYRRLHNTADFQRVFRNITSIREAVNDGKDLYLQIMKINETEEFLDRYYDFWEKFGMQIILQRQNTYLGRIADRNYSDLSPLERTPCWHLQRDLYILSDGRIGFCKEDIDGRYSRGSEAELSVADIWKNSIDNFIRDYGADYHTSPDCRSCGEWYTFNL